jgi:hypothetical protein
MKRRGGKMGWMAEKTGRPNWNPVLWDFMLYLYLTAQQSIYRLLDTTPAVVSKNITNVSETPHL